METTANQKTVILVAFEIRVVLEGNDKHFKRYSRLLQIGLAGEDLPYGSSHSSACQKNLNQQLSQDKLHICGHKYASFYCSVLKKQSGYFRSVKVPFSLTDEVDNSGER